MTWAKEKKALLKKVSAALQLEDDLLLDEIATAESKCAAIQRIDAIRQDAEDALKILTS